MLKHLTDEQLLQYKTLFEKGLNKSVRFENRKRYGFDPKFLYHVVRLLDEAQQILETGDIDLQRNREQLKSIRRGEVSEKEIRKWASDKEKYLEKLYEQSTLRWGPDEENIKKLLLNCLEEFYGSLDQCVITPSRELNDLKRIKEIVNKY